MRVAEIEVIYLHIDIPLEAGGVQKKIKVQVESDAESIARFQLAYVEHLRIDKGDMTWRAYYLKVKNIFVSHGCEIM